MDRHVRDVERRPVQDLELRVRADDADVLRRDEVVALHLAGLQSLQACGVVGDRPDDQRLDLRLRSPVARIRGEDDLLAHRPGHELERPGARRMAECIRAGRVERAVAQLAAVRTVLLERGRALDPERRDDERRQERRRALRQVDDRRVPALRRAALVDARREVRALVVVEPLEDGLPVVRGRGVLEGALEVVLAVEVVTDRRRVEWRESQSG